MTSILATWILTACGAPPEPASPPAEVAPPPAPAPTTTARARAPGFGPSGAFARIVDRRVALVSGAEKRLIEPEEIHLPPGERALFGIAPTALLWLDDGTLVVGASDGAVALFDGEGKRRSSLGFHGSIQGLTRAGEGLFAVTTAAGIAALVTSEGRLRWEREVTAEPLGPAAVARDGAVLVASERGVFALSAAGDTIFTHGARAALKASPPVTLEGEEIVAGALRLRRDAPHPEIPSREPTFPLRFELVAGGSYSALLAPAPHEITALGDYPRGGDNDWPSRATQQLVRVVDGKITRTLLPHLTAGKDPFDLTNYPSGGRTRPEPQIDPLVSDSLVTGPEGGTWILARRLSGQLTGGESGYTFAWVAAGVILEPGGKGARERRDLFTLLTAHPSVGDEGMLTAAPQGRLTLLCSGVQNAICARFGAPGKPEIINVPAPVVSVARIADEDWLVLKGGTLMRRRGRDLVELPAPASPPITAAAGTGDRDLWATSKEGWGVAHHDGAAWAEVAVPHPPGKGMFARAPDDVWALHGRARWDGKRWSMIYGAPDSVAVLARGRDDVWLAGEGLWHATAPGPAHLRLPAPPPDPGAAPAPAPLPLGPADTAFSAARWSAPVARGAPLTAARRVTAGGGVLWFSTWDRLIEVNAAGKATSLRSANRGFGVGRTVLPEAAGRGLEILGSAVRGVPAPKGGEVIGALDRRDLVALSGDPRGALWAVGGSDNESRWPYAMMRTTAKDPLQPVLGLPAAAWVDVAAAPDGGAWFAGGLSAGPCGEGVLFHARGPAGSGGTARYRASASLLAVAAGRDEAWAVGAAGVVVRVSGATITRWALPSGEWLRAVAIAGPREVWLGGDGGTLLRFDGESFHPVAHPLGDNASITSLALAGGALWATSPSGILRVVRR